MIAYLHGTIKSIAERVVVVGVQGVGYAVTVPSGMIGTLKLGDSVELVIKTIVKEDAFDLYGFVTDQDKQMFELLITISGVGPKSALGILDAASTEEITQAVLDQDPSILEKVSGIGKKTAERIVLELKNKIAKGVASSLFVGTSTDVEVLDALQALGYQLSEIREHLQSIDTGLSTEEKIKTILKNLGS